MDAHEPGRPEEPLPKDDPGSDAWPTVELDLTGGGAAPSAARTGSLGVGPRRRRREWSRRHLILAVPVLAVAIGIAIVSIGSDHTGPDAADVEPTPVTVERNRPTPASAGTSEETRAGAAGPIEAREVATLAIGDQVSGSSRELALVDSDGLRIADLDAGTLTDSTALGPVGVPVLVGPGQRQFVFVSRDELKEIDTQGRQRVIGVAHGQAVGLDRELVWMLARNADRNILTAVRRSSGAVAEEIPLDGSDVLIGFHAGRPLVAAGDVVIRHDPDASVVVSTGQVVASGGDNLLVRRCPEPGCDEAVLVDLDDRSERIVTLGAEVRAFGLGEALSPDGRWLVGLEFGDRSRPEVAIHPLAEPGAVSPEPLVLSLGVLGYGGRAAGVTWSPDGALLAAPGSSRVALVDVERRSTVTIPIRLSGSGPTVRWLAS